MDVTVLFERREEPRFIVVEGPIGVGKTSLANRLAERFSGEILLEEPGSNPFLERFYRSARAEALPAQLFFLFQRARQLDALRQSDMFATVRIADFHLDKDRLFAEINLDPEELVLYDQICNKMDIQTPVPDLVIYLQASVDVLLSRIARRGIGYERMIDRLYLDKVTEAYARYFHAYDSGPLLIVNASSIDFANNDADFEALFEHVQHTSGGRRFFNPTVAAALA